MSIKKQDLSPAERASERRRDGFLKELIEVEEKTRKYVSEIFPHLRRMREYATAGQTSNSAVYDDFVMAWERVTGDTYDADIRVGRGIITRLVKRKDAAEVRVRMLLFFQDGWARRQGFSVKAFGQMFDGIKVPQQARDEWLDRD